MGVWHRLLPGVTAVGLLVVVGCTTNDTDQAFDDDVAAEFDSVVERGAERTAAGGLVVWVDTPAGQRSMAAVPVDVDGEDELTGDQAFRIGSIIKLLTVHRALQLAEEGIVDLDAPITDGLPDRAADLEHDGQTNGGARGAAGDPPRKEWG